MVPSSRLPGAPEIRSSDGNSAVPTIALNKECYEDATQPFRTATFDAWACHGMTEPRLSIQARQDLNDHYTHRNSSARSVLKGTQGPLNNWKRTLFSARSSIMSAQDTFNVFVTRHAASIPPRHLSSPETMVSHTAIHGV